jgi:hypothetical protein
MNFVSQYNISINKVLGRLIPYFFRGRKLYALMVSLLSSLESTHDDFLKWGQKVTIISKLPFIKEPMEYMLKDNLGSYFANPEDSFCFDKYAHKRYGSYVYPITDETHQADAPVIYPFNEDDGTAVIYARKDVTGLTANKFNLSAPNIADSSKKEEYTTTIRLLLSQFTIIKKYDIIIQDF